MAIVCPMNPTTSNINGSLGVQNSDLIPMTLVTTVNPNFTPSVLPARQFPIGR